MMSVLLTGCGKSDSTATGTADSAGAQSVKDGDLGGKWLCGGYNAGGEELNMEQIGIIKIQVQKLTGLNRMM